jgi:hypothetical protein
LSLFFLVPPIFTIVISFVFLNIFLAWFLVVSSFLVLAPYSSRPTYYDATWASNLTDSFPPSTYCVFLGSSLIVRGRQRNIMQIPIQVWRLSCKLWLFWRQRWLGSVSNWRINLVSLLLHWPPYCQTVHVLSALRMIRWSMRTPNT